MEQHTATRHQQAINFGTGSTITGSAAAAHAAAGGHWVESHSAEFDLVRYHLSTACAHLGGSVEKVSVWKIDNMELQYKYERRSSGMLRLHGWINAEYLSAENHLEQVSSRGFFYDSTRTHGMEFPTGIIQSIPEYSHGIEYCFIFYEMAVGRSFVYDGDLSRAVVPSGFDSLYISSKPLDRNKDGKFSLHEYQLAAQFDNRNSSEYAHKYFINDMNQISPKYIVRFKVQKVTDQLAAADYLSNVTNSTVSDVQFIDPITLQPGTTTLGSPAAFGSSSTGLFSSPNPKNSAMSGLEKRFLSVEKVYNQALEELAYFDNDPSMISKSQWVNRQLSSIEDKVREINLNYVEIVEAIEEATKIAKEKLQVTVRSKLELCLSMEIELRRQQEQVKWLQGAVSKELKNYQQAIVESNGNDQLRRKLMLQFLKIWKQHNLMRNGLSRLKPNELQALNSIHGDVRVQPDIRLFTDPFYSLDKKLQESKLDGSSNKHGSIISNNKHLQEFTARAKTLEIFAPGVVPPGQSYISAPIQSVIDQEIDAIQKIIINEAASGGLRLPASITRPLTGGNNPPLQLHAALDWLKRDSSQDNLGVALLDALESASNLDDNENTDEILKATFAASLPVALGYKEEVTDISPSTPGPAKREELDIPLPSPLSESPGSHAHSRAAKLDINSSTPMKQVQAPITPESSISKSTQRNNHQDAISIASSNRTGAKAGAASVGTSVFDFAQGSDGEIIRRSMADLQKVVSVLRQFSLSDAGVRKRKQLQPRLAAGLDQIGYTPLKASRIIQPDEMEYLYYCLPFFSKPPTLRLLYSTHTHKRSIEELFSKTIKNRNPTLLVIRSGEFRFGAYLSHAPVPTSAWTGSPSCFLFSLTLNVKIPYHARHVLGESMSEPMALFAHGDRLFVGNGDLSIDSKLSSGTTELENSYGIGLEPHSDEAMCLLAGTPVFPIHELELWTMIV